MNKVLVLAVHPDDETLGCAGTLLKHKASGDKIYWLIATSAQEKYGYTGQGILQKEKEIESVATKYRFDKVYRLDIPTTRVDELPISTITQKISEVFRRIKPNIIYLPFNKDIHSDHRIIFEVAYSCTKVFRFPFIKKVLMMETLSETEFSPHKKDSIFIPQYFVNITPYLNKKLEIMKIYKKAMGSHPFPRSLKNIRALATLRGAMSGCKYAEAFMLLKEIK